MATLPANAWHTAPRGNNNSQQSTTIPQKFKILEVPLSNKPFSKHLQLLNLPGFLFLVRKYAILPIPMSSIVMLQPANGGHPLGVLLHIVWDLLGGRVAVVHRGLYGARMKQLHLVLHLSLLRVHPGRFPPGLSHWCPMGFPLCAGKNLGVLVDGGWFLNIFDQYITPSHVLRWDMIECLEYLLSMVMLWNVVGAFVQLGQGVFQSLVSLSKLHRAIG